MRCNARLCYCTCGPVSNTTMQQTVHCQSNALLCRAPAFVLQAAIMPLHGHQRCSLLPSGTPALPAFALEASVPVLHCQAKAGWEGKNKTSQAQQEIMHHPRDLRASLLHIQPHAGITFGPSTSSSHRAPIVPPTQCIARACHLFFFMGFFRKLSSSSLSEFASLLAKGAVF